MEKMTTGQYILIKYQDNMVICKGPTNGRFTIEMTTIIIKYGVPSFLGFFQE